MVLINILTRTSNRPLFFRDCVSSVRSQTHSAVRHIVGADDEASLNYARELVPDAVRLHRSEPEFSPHAFSAPYNLYLNTLMQEVSDGWIHFLDDDDAYTGADSLAVLASHMRDENSLLLWRVQFPDRVIPQYCFGHVPLLGDITGVGVAFHSKHRRYAQWDDVKGADHRVIERLFYVLEPIWIERTLTCANYPQIGGSFNGGLGQRRDKYDGLPAPQQSYTHYAEFGWPMTELEKLRARVAELTAAASKSGNR